MSRPLLAAAIVLAGLGASWPVALGAAPLAHKGSVVVSVEADPQWSSLSITPAFTRSTGVGPSLHWIKPEADSSRDGLGDGSNQELWNLVMVTHRLKRWNGAQYQANLWAGVGGGLLTVIPNNGASLHNRAAWSPWGQVDWETRRLYLGASARWFQAADVSRLMTSARAGVALTSADYDRWQPWLMVEARTMEGLQDGVEITPLLRLLHRRLLAEAGVSTSGTVRLNLTYTY